MTCRTCDVLWLADVFEHFKKTCVQFYKLDPASYLTSPSLAWDAMLLQTKIEREPINDVDMRSMAAKQKRGGLSYVGSKRHVKYNTKISPTLTHRNNQITRCVGTLTTFKGGGLVKFYKVRC